MKNTYRRRSLAMGAAATIVLGLGACSTGDSPAEGGASELKLWLPPVGSEEAGSDPSSWDDILADFEEANDVDVKVTVTPWANYEEKYLAGISSGEGPDVGYMYTEMLGDYIERGAIVPFDDYVDDEDTEKMLYLDQGQVEGAQWAMPFVVGNVRVTYVNNELLDEAGVTELPVTWDDFNAAADQLTEAGITATMQAWGSDRGMLNDTFFPALWQAGGEIFTEDGSATAFNSPAGLAAANQINDLIEDGNMPSSVSGLDATDVKQQFLDGKVAFWPAAQGQLAEIEDAGIDYSIIDSLTEAQQGTFVAADSLVLLDACEDKQLCADLVMYLESGEQMSQIHEIADYPPIATDEEVDPADPLATVYSEKSDMLHSLPIVVGGTPVYNALYLNLQQMILGQKTPEEALQDAASEGDSSLGSAG